VVESGIEIGLAHGCFMEESKRIAIFFIFLRLSPVCKLILFLEEVNFHGVCLSITVSVQAVLLLVILLIFHTRNTGCCELRKQGFITQDRR